MMKIKPDWRCIIIISAVFLLFIFLVFPPVNSYSIRMMGQSETPDTSLVYSAQGLYQMADNYGKPGRDAYIKLRWTFDLVWPVLYTLFLLLWTIKLSEYTSLKKASKYLFLIPVIGMILDFLENIGATIVMFRYPLKSGIIANITPIMTFLKWITLSVSVLVIIILLAMIGVGKIKKSSRG